MCSPDAGEAKNQGPEKNRGDTGKAWTAQRLLPPPRPETHLRLHAGLLGQVDLYTLQKLLTPKSPAMTQRYAHLRDEALRRASDLAGDLLGQVINGNHRKIANVEE